MAKTSSTARQHSGRRRAHSKATQPDPAAPKPAAGRPPLIVPFHGEEQAPSVSRAELGEKGFQLVEMARMGAPVPPGVVLTATLCERTLLNGDALPEGAEGELRAALEGLSAQNGGRFGDDREPLLLSLRSSPPAEIPETMKTVVGLGINDEAARALAGRFGDERMARDLHQRFLRSFGVQVLGMPPARFEEAGEDLYAELGVMDETELDAAGMEQLVQAYRSAFRHHGVQEPPRDPMEQVRLAARAGFRAWYRPESEERRLGQGLSETTGTALIIQPMIYGTAPGRSGAGRFVTRQPATGEKALYGKYLETALGPDLTAGTRLAEDLKTLLDDAPDIGERIAEWQERLESHFHDVQEVHFAVEDGRLYFLQTRSAPRTGKAGLRIATDMVDEGLASEQQALLHLDPSVLTEYLHPVLDPKAPKAPFTSGLPASPGSAVGQVVFFAEHAEELASQGVRTILVRHETTPEDIGGLTSAEGILTVTGGLTSHAAVVARGMGKCCVVGAGEVDLNYHLQEMTVGDTTVKRLDWVSLDGNTGKVYKGELPQIQPALEGSVARVLKWADRHRRLRVRTNADTAGDAAHAVELGAEGIGLCRTEHMFFEIDRIPLFRKMILAVDHIGRSAALSELLPLQRKDFMELYRVMDGRPVTIRLLDPPLHEFLPRGIRSQTRMAKAMGIPVEMIQRRTEMLHETNPMMGHRGCRLAITFPEIYHMQVRAIVEAACIVHKEGAAVHPEIMVPLVSSLNELDVLRKEIDDLVRQVMAEMGEDLPIPVGTMVETPRAAVCAGSVARRADFFSFGTNDLTQMAFGFSRDDAGVFLPTYLERGILDRDPFVALDLAGVGGLMKMAIAAGRRTNAQLKVGICGEHGGEPHSVHFAHKVGLDYVSCSPFRVPIARLAAAQAAVREKEAAA